jgi:hypothetical protein
MLTASRNQWYCGKDLLECNEIDSANAQHVQPHQKSSGTPYLEYFSQPTPFLVALSLIYLYLGKLVRLWNTCFLTARRYGTLSSN